MPGFDEKITVGVTADLDFARIDVRCGYTRRVGHNSKFWHGFGVNSCQFQWTFPSFPLLSIGPPLDY